MNNDNTDIVILYVEDNDGDVELLNMSLERYCPTLNIRLNVAETFAEAKTLLHANQHSAALLDWNLPDANGPDVAKFIRAQDANFPIVFLSGVFTDSQLTIAKEYKPFACLEKNYNGHFIEQIQALVKQVALENMTINKA